MAGETKPNQNQKTMQQKVSRRGNKQQVMGCKKVSTDSRWFLWNQSDIGSTRGMFSVAVKPVRVNVEPYTKYTDAHVRRKTGRRRVYNVAATPDVIQASGRET